MGDNSKIQWTDATWNPVTGCTKVSQGCKHCYAETLANRMWASQYPPNADGTPRRFTDVRLHEDRLDQPIRWKRPRRIFVNSMSDLFHEDVPDDFIDLVFGAMALSPQHVFQVLTKRPERMRRYLNAEQCFTRVEMAADHLFGKLTGAGTFLDTAAWPLPNVWLGVSVENQETADERIPLLVETPATIRFISAEPLLSHVDLEQAGAIEAAGPEWAGWNSLVDWVIIGGESGRQARGFDTAWASRLIAQCRQSGIACFVKQMGAAPYYTSTAEKTAGAKVRMQLRDGHGGEPDEWPADLRVREFPAVLA